MSSASSGSYSVVSEEELRRRRLAAAQDRHERLLRDLAALNSEIGSAVATYGTVSSEVLDAVTPGATTPEGWELAADELNAQISARRKALQDDISRSRSALFASKFSELAPSTRTVDVAAEDKAADQELDGELQRVLDRLPATASRGVAESCLSFSERYRTTRNVQERERLMSAIRLHVQTEQDRARAIEANRGHVERLYQQLDGHTGRDVETLRGQLKGLRLDAPVPPELTPRVAEVARAASAEQDRTFVLLKASAVLEELGYAVGEDFVTAVPEEGALVNLPHSHDHGVLIRERNRQLLVNVVRYDEAGERDQLEDMQAEEQFCDDFSAFRARLRDSGIDLDVNRSDPPGSRPTQVVRNVPPRAKRDVRVRRAPRRRRPQR